MLGVAGLVPVDFSSDSLQVTLQASFRLSFSVCRMDLFDEAASNGCVRMHNEHVVELFEKVKMGTPVTVEN